MRTDEVGMDWDDLGWNPGGRGGRAKARLIADIAEIGKAEPNTYHGGAETGTNPVIG